MIRTTMAETNVERAALRERVKFQCVEGSANTGYDGFAKARWVATITDSSMR